MKVLACVCAAIALLGAACASHPPPEEEFTPQIRVVPGAASRSLWIGHKGVGDAGDVVPGADDAGPPPGTAP